MSEAAMAVTGADRNGETARVRVQRPAAVSQTTQDRWYTNGWRHRLVFGMTGLALLGIVSCGALALVTLGSPLPDDALIVDPGPQYLARLDASFAYGRTLDHVAWLLQVTGATTWLPLTGLFCVRSYVRHGWTRAIPIALTAALVTSAAVAAQAWHSCSTMAGPTGECW